MVGNAKNLTAHNYWSIALANQIVRITYVIHVSCIRPVVLKPLAANLQMFTHKYLRRIASCVALTVVPQTHSHTVTHHVADYTCMYVVECCSCAFTTGACHLPAIHAMRQQASKTTHSISGSCLPVVFFGNSENYHYCMRKCQIHIQTYKYIYIYFFC